MPPLSPPPRNGIALFALLLAIPTISFLGWSWWLLIPLGLACSQLVGMFAPLFSDDDIAFEPLSDD